MNLWMNLSAEQLMQLWLYIIYKAADDAVVSVILLLVLDASVAATLFVIICCAIDVDV